MENIWLFLRICLLHTLNSVGKASVFQEGFDHHYVYKAKSDFLGMQNVTTIIKFHIQHQNVSKTGDKLNTLWLDSFVQFTQSGQYADNPKKWNLSRPFLFTVSPKGIVLHTFVHSEEEDEVLTLKKVVSSTFSANVTIKNDTQWKYSSTDSDHIGTLAHEYTGTRTDSGIRLSRYHRSVEHVERIHAKTLHIDKYGTIESVEGEDSIILENRLDSKFNSKRIPYPDNTTEEGGIGVIKTNAEINMKLLSKRPIRQKSGRIMFHGLRLDNVLYQKKKQKRESLASLEANIKAAIDCCHQYSDKSNTNRTICVNNLRQNITSLNEKDYEAVVSEFLSKECEPNDTKCEDERLLFTDIVAREGSELSQRLVVKYVFQRRILDEEAIRRALIHFTTLVKPTTETVTAVKKLCFGEKSEHHGAVNMTVMVQRSCLALGSLAKALRKSGNDTVASAILEHLHTWLYEQGDETPEHLRPRRSTINVESTVSDDHLLSKFVLLHSLGNAAHPSSLKYLHEYATPNARVPAWRRAALTAMKYDKGNETARVLLDSLTFDKTETVRSIAMEQFLAHPLQKNFTKHLGDTLLSQNYTYPTIVRLKRAFDLNAVLLEFKVELPKVQWVKAVGNKDIGASFGVDMVNKMHLRIQPLSSFFHIDVRNSIYAEAHVGILDINVDILRIEVCYKGKLGYNLNILKDFSYGEAQRDFDDFSREASSILSPLFHAVDGITTHFRESSRHQSAFQSLIDTVKKIPDQARRTFESSNNLQAVLKTFQALPLVSKARRLAFKLQGLAEDIRTDTLNFQSEIADTALIAIPHAETQMTESLNMISEVQRKIGSHPQQAFETINMAKQRIKYATYQFLKAKSVIQNVLSPHGGSLPTWLSSKDEIRMAISNAGSLLSEIKSAQEHFATLQNKDTSNFVKWQEITDIKNALSMAATDLKNLNASVNPCHTVFTDSLKKMQNIKLSVDEMDKKTKETQSFIRKIFGPKFNVAFPAKRRGKDYECGGGIWPSTTGGRYSDYPGIDVIVEENEKVVNPVNGKVFRTRKDGEVRIIPSDDNFKMFTVLISNIRLGDFISTDGSEMKAGQTIGHGKGKNGCSEPYIHVAISRNAEDGSSKCSFEDPSAYPVDIKPSSLWEEECREFTFKHIGHTIEAALSGFDFKDIVDNFIKRAIEWAKTTLVKKILPHILNSAVSSVSEKMANSYLSQYNCEISDTFMKPGSQSKIGNKKCRKNSGRTSSQPFNTGKQQLSQMIKNLQRTSLQKSVREIQDIMRKIKSSASGIKLDDISSMAFSRYGKILDKLNVPYKGGKQSMETVIQMLTWNVCPSFVNGIAQGYGHLCTPSNDCFGLNCTIHIPDGIKKERVNVAVQFNRIDSTFTLITRNYDTKIAVDGTHKQYKFEDMLPPHVVTILSHTKLLNVPVGKAFQLTLSAVVCDKYAHCLQEVHIFEKLTFLVQLRSIKSTSDDCILGANVNINNVGHFGGGLHIDSTGRMSSGSFDAGLEAGGTYIGGKAHTNSHGEWAINVEADMDLVDETTLETSMSFEGKYDKISFGLGVEAEIGDGKNIGGFIDSDIEGAISLGLQGNMNVGSNNENTKDKLSASFKTSSAGTIDAGLSGSAQIGNSIISGGGYIHHTKDGTSGGRTIAGKINKNGNISALLDKYSKGKMDVGASGSVKIGDSSISGFGYFHKKNNGTNGRGKIDAVINNNGQISASSKASSEGTVNAVVNGSTQMGSSTISGAGYIHDTKHNTSGERTVAAHHVNVRNADNCLTDFTADVGDDGFGIGGNVNIPGFGKLGAHFEIKDGQLRGKLNIADFSMDFEDIGKITMDSINQLASDFNINSDTTGLISKLRDGTKDKVCTLEAKMTVGLKTEMFEEDSPARDKKDGVVYPDKYIDITFFQLRIPILAVGPIGISFGFGGGGAIGTSMWNDIRAMRGDATFSVGPWVSGLVWGELVIDLGLISGGLRLKGYILKTKFPITTEIKSNKHPITVVENIDLELTPIELRLYAWVKIFFWTVYNKCIWKWACTPITWNVLRQEKIYKDKGQPKFVSSSSCGYYRRKREVNECSVRQIQNRHPSDTAFQLEISATDVDSGVNTWFAIGTSPGGKDVKVWTKFKGNNQVVPSKMPNGVPLYFTIKAQNEQGLESYIQCKLETYDNTLPDGRVEASHKFSSHPRKIGATVIVIDDSIIKSTYKALGLSPGQYGSEMVDWKLLSVSKTTIRSGISSDLKHFSSPRKGKLIVTPIESSISEYPETCAGKCLRMAQCISFNYEQQSETCQLHDVVESHTNQLHVNGDFYNYERLGGGYSSYIEYQNQPFEHGTVYYVNVFVENSLGYQSTLFSEGTLIDFTPPVPGYPGNVSRDVTVSHRCKSSVRQRCEQVTDLPNHRIVVDGPDGRTVFNGNEPLHDTRFTLTNHYVTANWDGFTDPESGIWGYAWAVGTKHCGEDIVKFEDPHKNIPSPNHWTSTGFHENLALRDGEYYVTVEALNNVVFGGALVTTVCHSVPFLVDTTSPDFHNVTDVMFDEDFDILAAYYNVSDKESGITRVDFGLGMTKHDVELRAYSRHDFMERNDPYLVIEHLELQPGIPAWVRLRAVNKVGLFAAGHAKEPIIVDKTPPIPGIVIDGNTLREDADYQHDTEQICAQWQDFFDPESGINRFMWGVGTHPQEDDIVPFKNMSKFVRHSCIPANLRHNVTYFSTVVAINDALNTKRSNSSSNGVLVDITPPIPGKVDDRSVISNFTDDIDYTSETATVLASWQDFYDPESGIDHYDINIEINNETDKFLPLSTDTFFEDHSFTIHHLDFIQVEIYASNGANLQTSLRSDGVLVDHTPPNLLYVYDTQNNNKFQSDNTKLYLKWEFSDLESGLAEYRYMVKEIDSGITRTIYPENGDFSSIDPQPQMVSMEIEDQHLKSGALYKVHVIAVNKAKLSSSYLSAGVLIDTTPPVLKHVKLALPNEEEDLDETDTYVLHAGTGPLTISWLARDSESGIQEIKVGFGNVSGDTSLTKGFIVLGNGETHTLIRDLNLLYYEEDAPVLYYASVIAVNRAGLESNLVSSKPIKVLQENVPGTVFDGRQDLQDSDYTKDKTSIGISFADFESKACNIVSYEWAVGSEPYLTDILPFTDYGIVMINESKGHAHINIELKESQIYFATVRARTGQMCKEEFIMSVSDGITVDSKGPEIKFEIKNNKNSAQDIGYQSKSIYQQTTENLDISWSVTDISGIATDTWSIGSLPERDDIHNLTESNGTGIPQNSVSLHPGTANFVTVRAKDKAGNQAVMTSPAFVVDTSVPEIDGFSCTKVFSNVNSLLSCKWLFLSEKESTIISLSYGISSSPLALDILNFTEIPVERRSWYRNIADYVVNADIEKIYMSLRVKNSAGQVFITEETAIIDRTPPFNGTVKIVTRDSFTSTNIATICQLSQQYVEIEVKGFTDEESSLSRLEVGLGSDIGETDIRPFAKFDIGEHILIDGLQLFPGMTVFATVKVYNEVNLYSTTLSQGVIISPSPILTVLDGHGQKDEDYLSDLNIIQGRWDYTDHCPITKAEWAVRDLLGNAIQEFKPILNANTHFINDELRTENGHTYINIIRTTDALNRTRIAYSDGITVRIQPPKFANVRDGLESEDINYQRSVSELTGNWDEFGDHTSEHPSQLILKYEVAVGDDIRFPNTRTNIHPFMNVGLNRTIVFKKLKLVAKKSRYFLTVRAFSAAGSFVEGYSNGIRVGYEETIKPGDLKYEAFQSSYQNIEISWSDFISDYGIRQYEIAVSTVTPNTTDDTVDCNVLKSDVECFDIKQLSSVGLNTVTNITGLLLSHGKSYFVTILAEDESKSCIAVTSGPILIDTSEPVVGNVFLNNIETGTKYNFINSSTLKVSWDNFSDTDSGICCYRVFLAEQDGCGPSSSSRHVVQEKSVNITEVTFYQLQEEKKYIIKVTVTNKANLSSSITTASIFLDKKRPLIGHVKVGIDWKRPVSVQHSSTTLNGTILIARTQDGYTCPLQKDFSPSPKNLFSTWHPLTGDFTPKCISVTNNRLIIEVKIDEHNLSEIVKGGVQTNEMEIKDGLYAFRMTGLRGENMVTSVSILREHSAIPFNFSESLDDINDSSEQYENDTNESPDGIKRMSAHDHYGTGFLIPGYRIRNETNIWNILFWAADRYDTKLAWIAVDFDPSDKEAKYDISLMKENETSTMKWNIIFSVNDEEKATINAMTFQNKIRISLEGYNKNSYVPDVEDIFSPFHSEIKLSSVHVPSQKDTPCRYGKPFFDGDGDIHEIWAGVSKSQNETETIVKYALQKTYCLPCKGRCHMECDVDCSVYTNEPLEIIYITLSNLTMLPSSNISLEMVNNISSGLDFGNFSTESYYINIKVVDFAGNFIEAISEAVIIDDTPPKFNQMSCVDPRHSLDEPTLYQGTNSSVAAFWECEDDISQITEYTACVGSSAGDCNIKPVENNGLRTSVLFEGLSGLLLDGYTYFVTVTAYNAAGLKTSESCNITVQLQLPETSHSESKEMFSTPVENALPTVAFSDRTDRLGVYWESRDSDTEFYEWEMGSNDTASDIFPRVKIGTKNSTKAAVIDGHLWLDGVNINTTVKEYVLRNWTEEEMAEAKSHGNVFNFEPGRCIHVNLYSVNQAHLSSKIPVKPVCMKRKDDIFINFEQEAGQKVIAANNSLTIHRTDVLDGDMALKLTFNGTEGGMLVGLLKEADLEGMYGSSASDSYRPFIASPLTKTKTSRLMRNRFHGYSGLSFYISPTGYTKLNNWIDVSIQLNNTEESYVPALIYWDQVSEEWKKITEDCETEENINSQTNTYSAKICLPLHISQRQRRSIDISSEVDGPRQFSLVFISKDITETQPVIITDSLTYSEDEANVELKRVDYYDAEDDNISFRLIGYPKHGFANITSDGKLYYKPDADFSGNDEVIVECTETSLPYWERPRPFHARVNIFVSEVNDAPDLLFLRDNDTFTGDRVNEIILPMESNTTGYFIGTFLATDIDLNDSLTEMVFDTSPSEANLTLYELQDPYLLEMFNSSNITAAETIKLFQLELSMSKDFFGVIEYGLIVHDNAGHWSLPIKLSIGVLYNPCVFGYCASRENLPCTDFARAKSFDSFQCTCKAGYEGVWCETETNECRSEPCARMFDCEDLVAGFQCNINVLKLLATLVCSLLALTVGVVSIICCRKRCSGKMKLSEMEQKKTTKDKWSLFDPGNAKFKKIETEADL